MNKYSITQLYWQLTLCASPNAAQILLVLKKYDYYHKYASHTHTHNLYFITAVDQRIEEMLMCPAAFLFGTSADGDPASGPVGPYLQQNDYSFISMQILPEENKQTK